MQNYTGLKDRLLSQKADLNRELDDIEESGAQTVRRNEAIEEINQIDEKLARMGAF